MRLSFITSGKLRHNNLRTDSVQEESQGFREGAMSMCLDQHTQTSGQISHVITCVATWRSILHKYGKIKARVVTFSGTKHKYRAWSRFTDATFGWAMRLSIKRHARSTPETDGRQLPVFSVGSKPTQDYRSLASHSQIVWGCCQCSDI